MAGSRRWKVDIVNLPVRWTVRIVGALLVMTLLAGCSGDGEGGGTTDDGTGATNIGGASDPGAGNSSGAVPGPSNDCPLSAEQVSEVLGVTVEKEATLCMFDGPSQNVTYVRQVSFACSEGVIGDPSFEMEPFDGLGVGAYAAPQGADLLVCTDPPFEITVDITPDLDDLVADATAASAAAEVSERAAAEELARLVLAGE
jgi:hypothetical protein